MNPKMRRNFSGEFRAQDLGKGVWRLIRTSPPQAAVILQGAERNAGQVFGAGAVLNLGIEWHADMALLSFMSGDRVETVESASVIVHEPLEQLYEKLPLASFDAKARRFWRRVFSLVRIPGGRYLLRFLGRAN
jgi:hypothetical protein